MTAGMPRVFSIPPGVPFLPTFVQALATGEIVPGFSPEQDPLSLSEATIYVPTRRAGRALEDAFLDGLGRDALLMPRIAPLGDVDEDALLSGGFGGESALAIPDAVDPLQRRLELSGLVAAYSGALRQAVTAALGDGAPDDPFFLTSCHPAAILRMADELAALVDGFETEDVPFERLGSIEASGHDRYWAITLEFLRIAGEGWPKHLAEIGRLDPSRRRSLLLAAEAARLADNPPRGPVVAVGSTGSIPATARLLAAIARLPNGAVVLPGLDVAGDAFPDPDDDKARSFGHPQFGLARLLRTLKLPRTAVVELGRLPPALQIRRRFVGEAMRAASTTDRWPHARAGLGDLSEALSGVTLVEAANEREEAVAVALLLRETVEKPGRTAALVTPDRRLARRVASELRRWSLDIEDSAGRPLLDAAPAVLCQLVAEAAGSNLTPETLLPLVRHPLARFNHATADAMAAAADALEIAVLRGPAPRPGFAGMQAALAAAQAPPLRGVKGRLPASGWTAAADLLTRIGDALAPLLALSVEAAGMARFAAATIQSLVAATSGGEPEVPSTAADMLATRLADVAAADCRLPLRLGDWPPTLRALLSDLVLPSPSTGHPRLAILGLLEARLLHFDRIVLGGLSEGTWPPVPTVDPWLNRSFRRDLKLTPPERRIGLSAHDFAQALGSADVAMVRARRSGEQPTVPSRFLQRLEAFAGAAAWTAVEGRGEQWLTIARQLDFAPTAARLKPPEPRPAQNLRPKVLSVTEIETLVRDPYAIYARRILKLDPLDAVGETPDAADRGSIIHEAIAKFVVSGDDPAGPGAFETLCALGRIEFGDLLTAPDVAALWWPRFERVARWFLGWEARRRAGIETTLVEQSATLTWTRASGRPFTLTARADRLDLGPHGWTIVDYKTGKLPTPPEIKSGFASQLPLEGAMLLDGGFAAARPLPIADLLHVQLGGGTPPGREQATDFKATSMSEASREALVSLKTLLDRFESEDVPYLPRTRPKPGARHAGDYDHLSRVREWSATGDVEEAEEES